MTSLLFVDMHANIGFARLPELFKKPGVSLHGLAFEDKILLRSNALDRKYTFPDKSALDQLSVMANRLGKVSDDCKADFLLTSDENLIRNLFATRKRLRSMQPSHNLKQANFLAVLEKSLVADEGLFIRSRMMEEAKKSGFLIPEGYAVGSLVDFISDDNRMSFPFFLKANFEAGGNGVSRVASMQELKDTIAYFSRFYGFVTEDNPAIVQKEVTGQELNICFAAWDGQLLGYFVLQPMEKMSSYGVNSVVKSVYRPSWSATLEKLVRQIRFSGFGGLDVIETSEQELPYVLEANLRPTLSLQLDSIVDGNLVSLFHDALINGVGNEQNIHHPDCDRTVAKFPNELLRDAKSPYLKTVPMNIPWDDPGILQEHLQTLGMSEAELSALLNRKI